MAFLNAAPEWWLECVLHVLLRHHSIESISGEVLPLLQIISSVVLAAGRKHHLSVRSLSSSIFVIGVMLPLKPFDVFDGVGGGEHGVLAGGLLAAAPPGVAEDVDVGRPEGEAGLADVVHGAGLDGDGLGEGAPEGAVEGGGGEDDLGEGGGGADGAVEDDAGAVGGEAVEGLGPPLEGREAEAGDGGGAVGELVDLLIEGQEGDEGARAGGDGEGGVAERVVVVRVVARVRGQAGGGTF